MAHQAALGDGTQAFDQLGNGLHVGKLGQRGGCLQLACSNFGCDLDEELARLRLLLLKHFTRRRAFGVGHVAQARDLVPYMPSHLLPHGLELLGLHSAVRAHYNHAGFRNVGGQQLQPNLERRNYGVHLQRLSDAAV